MDTKTKRYIIVAASVVVTLSAFLVAVLYSASKNGVNVPVKAAENLKEPDKTDIAENAAVMPDVTGMNYEEAQELLEKFLSENDLKVRIVVGWGYNSDPSKSHLVAVSTPNAGKTIDSSTKEIILMVYEGYTPPETTTEETTIIEETTTEAEPAPSTGGTAKPTETSVTEESTDESEPTTESTEPSESSDPSESSEETEPTASSSEEETIVMPDVVGMNYHDAMDLLEKFFKDNNLEIKIILGWGPNSDSNKNLLVSTTTPKAGTVLDSSTKEIIMMVYEGYNPPAGS